MIFQEIHPRFYNMLQEHGTTGEKLDFYWIERLLQNANVFNAVVIISEEIEKENLDTEENSVYFEVRDLLARDNYWYIDETHNMPYYI